MSPLEWNIYGISIISWFNVIVVILLFHWFVGIPNVFYLVMILKNYAASWRRGKLKALETAKLESRAYLSWIDDNIHMNNTVYFSEFEKGRRDWFFRVGSFDFIRKYNSNIVLTSITTRFRKEINPMQQFQIQTKLIYYDEFHIYLEQRIVAAVNGMVMCIAYADCAVIDKSQNRRTTTNAFIKHLNIPYVKKKKMIENAPSSLLHWIEYLKTSSTEIRAESGLGPKKD